MAPNLPPKDASDLGESWVVASRLLEDPQHTKEQRSEQGDSNAPESLATSSSSISGPELIMPSIYEVPVSEKSWVAPDMRTGNDASPTPRRRHKHKPKDADPEDRSRRQDEHARRKPKAQTQQRGMLTRALKAAAIRALNSALILAILHLLLLPELVYQFQALCGVPTLSTLYGTSCTRPSYTHPHAQDQPQTDRYTSVLTAQTRLESLFNTTLVDTSPLTNTLRESSTNLHLAAATLRRTHPGWKNELDLEFDGCELAVRAATRKFDTLVADVHSAVGSLLATGSLGHPASEPGPGPKGKRSKGRTGVAQEARASTQIQRRKQYIDQLAGRMRSKAEALGADLVTLDDHLESIGEIVGREWRGGESIPSDSLGGAYLQWLLPELPERFVSFFQPSPQSPESGSTPEESARETFQDAARHHRPVAEMVRTLVSRLQALQALQALQSAQGSNAGYD
ncbi:hypothetical protein PHISP_04578 [Aspergillus sp. HF37]|nr:hypothetical protein PHISP_04578 [Aspergillus sp. HF37]